MEKRAQTKEEKTIVDIMHVQAATIQAKVVDDNIMCKVIIDLINMGVMEKTPKASNIALANEVVHHDKEPTSKQSTTSNEATSKENNEPNVVNIYSNNLGPASLNYAPSFL